jgi:hypothetical protein
LDHRGKGHSDQSGVDEQECCNCEVANVAGTIGPMHSTPKGILCEEFFIYWQNSGLMRPELQPSNPTIKKIKRPPKNMALDLDNLMAMNIYDRASTSDVDGNETIDPVDKLEDEIRLESALIQSLNQSIGDLTHRAREGMESVRLPMAVSSSGFLTTTANIHSSTWSTEEILLAIQAFGKYGKDFDAVARIIGPSKSVIDVETFFLENRERYKLDTAIELNIKRTTTTGVQRKQQASNDVNNANEVVIVS